jgi:hypothetical protein
MDFQDRLGTKVKKTQRIWAFLTGETVTVTALQEGAGTAGGEGLSKTSPAGAEGKGYKVVVKKVTIGADGTAKLDFKSK